MNLLRLLNWLINNKKKSLIYVWGKLLMLVILLKQVLRKLVKSWVGGFLRELLKNLGIRLGLGLKKHRLLRLIQRKWLIFQVKPNSWLLNACLRFLKSIFTMKQDFRLSTVFCKTKTMKLDTIQEQPLLHLQRMVKEMQSKLFWSICHRAKQGNCVWR